MNSLGLVEGTRELLEYPYIIVYQVHDDGGEVVVLSIVHGARDRENERR
jgi:toxin ParE1/3/4